jgi:hypothetical protein
MPHIPTSKSTILLIDSFRGQTYTLVIMGLGFVFHFFVLSASSLPRVSSIKGRHIYSQVPVIARLKINFRASGHGSLKNDSPLWSLVNNASHASKSSSAQLVRLYDTVGYKKTRLTPMAETQLRKVALPGVALRVCNPAVPKTFHLLLRNFNCRYNALKDDKLQSRKWSVLLIPFSSHPR